MTACELNLDLGGYLAIALGNKFGARVTKGLEGPSSIGNPLTTAVKNWDHDCGETVLTESKIVVLAVDRSNVAVAMALRSS
jgi:hypothetical protein